MVIKAIKKRVSNRRSQRNRRPSLLGRTVAGRVVRGAGVAAVAGGAGAALAWRYLSRNRPLPDPLGRPDLLPSAGKTTRSALAAGVLGKRQTYKEYIIDRLPRPPSPGRSSAPYRMGKGKREVWAPPLKMAQAKNLRNRSAKANQVNQQQNAARRSRGLLKISPSRFRTHRMITEFAEFRRSRKRKSQLRRRVMGRTTAGRIARGVGAAAALGGLGAAGYAAMRNRKGGGMKNRSAPTINRNISNIDTGPGPVNARRIRAFSQTGADMQALTMKAVEQEILSGRAEFARRKKSKKGSALTGRTTAGRIARGVGAAAALGGLGAAGYAAMRNRKGGSKDPVGLLAQGKSGGAMVPLGRQRELGGAAAGIGRRRMNVGARAMGAAKQTRKRLGQELERIGQRMKSKSYGRSRR